MRPSGTRRWMSWSGSGWGKGREPKTLICEIRSRGEPRYLREAITRLRELRAHLPGAYPVVAAPLCEPQSAALVRRQQLRLPGPGRQTATIAFDNVLIQKGAGPQYRAGAPPAQGPLCAPGDPGGARPPGAGAGLRLDELGRAVGVSLGHAHNVIKRLEGLDWVERGRTGCTGCARRASSSTRWRDAYSYRSTASTPSSSPTGDKRRAMEAWRGTRPSSDELRFTLHAGSSLIGPHRASRPSRYVSGNSRPWCACSGSSPSR
jgi:hypothetical protein